MGKITHYSTVDQRTMLDLSCFSAFKNLELNISIRLVGQAKSSQIEDLAEKYIKINVDFGG